MVAFELSMPNRGSWNNRWTGEDRRYVRVYDQRTVPKNTGVKIFITHGLMVGQLVFATMTSTPQNVYNGKYQGQQGVTGSQVYKD